jgi:chorismate dehydratase
MSRVRLGAVGYLNARPLVFGLDRSARMELRFDVPSRCAELLHSHAIDVGLIPSIEYLRNPAAAGSDPANPAEAGSHASGEYRIVPGVAIASRGPVASVALFTTRQMKDVRSIAMDTSSRTSVALVRVLCTRYFRIDPKLEEFGPDLELMLERCDAALMIGDNALFAETGQLTVNSRQSTARRDSQLSTVNCQLSTIEKIDLGEVWTTLTGLPFVWAFWAGRAGALTPEDVAVLLAARDEGVQASELIARRYYETSPERWPVAAKYLRDNIKYYFGADEQAGLELFFRYAAEDGLVEAPGPVRFF